MGIETQGYDPTQDPKFLEKQALRNAELLDQIGDDSKAFEEVKKADKIRRDSEPPPDSAIESAPFETALEYSADTEQDGSEAETQASTDAEATEVLKLQGELKKQEAEAQVVDLKAQIESGVFGDAPNIEPSAKQETVLPTDIANAESKVELDRNAVDKLPNDLSFGDNLALDNAPSPWDTGEVRVGGSTAEFESSDAIVEHVEAGIDTNEADTIQ